MFCTKCGTKNEEGVNFCKNCGNRLNQPEEVTSGNAGDSQGNNKGTEFTSSVQNDSIYTPQNHSQFEYDMQPMEKKNKNVIIGIFAVAAISVIAFVFLFLKFYDSSKGVLSDILTAAQNTVEAGSFEMKLSVKEDGYGETIDGVFVIDPKKEKFEFDYSMDDERFILYDNKLYEVYDDEIEYDESLEDELEEFFGYYKEFVKSSEKLSSFEWEDIFDGFGLSSYVDVKKFEKCVKQVEKNLNDDDYYKKFCNSFTSKKSPKGKTYHMDVQVDKFLKALIKDFEPAFEDLNYWGMTYDDIADMLVSEIDVVKKLVIDVVIKDGKLVGLDLDIIIDGWTEQQFTINAELSKVGKASIDEKEIKKMIDEYSNY